MTTQAWFALGIFLGSLWLIASGKVARSLAALLGCSLLMAFHILPAPEAVRFIDFNTIGLLLGMMIMVGILSRTGVFQYVAIRTMKLTRGNGLITMAALSAVTAVLSAFLDNVTTVLLICPIIISLADLMEIDPVPLLIPVTLASNIGGTATLIGDPPNIIIGSYGDLSFLDFIVNLGPPVVIILTVALLYLAFHFRSQLAIPRDHFERVLHVDEQRTVTDALLLKKTGTAMLLVLAAFTVHHIFHLEPAVIALLGASLLLSVSGLEGREVIHQDVEWPTLVFFAALFILVGALKETGIISLVAQLLAHMVLGKPLLAILVVLWMSGLTCTVVNNIAFTATFVHVVQELAQTLDMATPPLYWALALGACLGGNGTFLGAAANVVVADIAERSGFPISFRHFAQLGMRTVLISLSLSSLYLLVRYLWIGA
ncbi:MAG: ArsB/NhaD family transporter [Synergistales bacterium]|nr:ArsB/NhaD family transporter [Synergistales bacterium]